MHQAPAKLVTGIPRSGTTLCCHILNQQKNIVALHEPIRPDQFNVSKASIGDFVKNRCEALKQAIFNGQEFEHGHKGGLEIDNPVGTEQKNGKRQVTAQRGLVSLSQFTNTPISLIVKQNAFFTAYLDQLSSDFDVLCIVRNPVDVLLSWWTVDLPVARGRLPAGENNHEAFKQKLAAGKSILKKQLIIYQWFIDQFSQSTNAVIRYEDIIASNGEVLTQHFNVSSPVLSELKQPFRQYEPNILAKLEHASTDILALNCNQYYKQSFIKQRLAELL